MMRGKKVSAASPMRKALARIVVGLVSTAISILAAQFVAERYFFDKFYYRKSVAHGYEPRPNAPLPRSEFGRRAQHVVQLNAADRPAGQAKLAPRPGSSPYTIVVLGDSFCWGSGLRDEQRWVHLLEERLNKVRPTRIIPLCEPGNGLLDHLMKYRASRRLWSADLYLFALVTDDLLYYYQKTYKDRAVMAALAACAHLPAVRWTGNSTLAMLAQAYTEGSANRCVMEQVITRLPAQRAIYVDYGWPWNTYAPLDEVLMQRLRQQGREVMTLIKDPEEEAEDAQGGLDQDGAPAFYYVSERERHPSRRLNAAFAEALYQRITSGAASGALPQAGQRSTL